MRTLIISDLHLGTRAHNDVLRLAIPREQLLHALDGIDRLVLLGDTVELMTRTPRRSMASAESVLRELGRRLGSAREVILVPGNHDAPLIRAWTLQRGADLGVEETVAPDVSPALARVTSWLAPARVTVRYPGVWLNDRVWATHGHYLDHHLLPDSAFGLPRGRLRDPGRVTAALPVDYERSHRRGRRRRPREDLPARLTSRPVATILETTAEMLRRMTMPQLAALMMNIHLAPVTARLLDTQMRHCSLAAMGHVARRLGIGAEWVVFGHVHRTGPLEGDRWPHPPRGPRLLNAGSWVYERLLVDRVNPPHPYWPGGAVLLEPGREPRALNLLDGLGAAELDGP